MTKKSKLSSAQTGLSTEEVAIHESGHAVAAYLMQHHFDYVTVEPNGTSRGHVMLTPDKDDYVEVTDWVQKHENRWTPRAFGDVCEVRVNPRVMTNVIERLIIIAAGDAARVRFTGTRGGWIRGSYLSWGHGETFYKLARAVTMSEKEMWAFCKYVEEYTLNLFRVKPYWKTVKALTAALQQSPHLDEQEATIIIQGTLKANQKRAMKDYLKRVSKRDTNGSPNELQLYPRDHRL
jgi:hypothetical protein